MKVPHGFVMTRCCFMCPGKARRQGGNMPEDRFRGAGETRPPTRRAGFYFRRCHRKSGGCPGDEHNGRCAHDRGKDHGRTEMHGKAVALFSGGPDSTLAVKVMLDQGIEIEAVNFTSLFCNCNPRKEGCVHQASKAAREFGIPIRVLTKGMEYMRVVERPRYGYGRGMNPCTDCRIDMFRKGPGAAARGEGLLRRHRGGPGTVFHVPAPPGHRDHRKGKRSQGPDSAAAVGASPAADGSRERGHRGPAEASGSRRQVQETPDGPGRHDGDYRLSLPRRRVLS